MITPPKAPVEGRYVTLAGNITRDPELRFSSKGTAWCSVGLAVTPRARGDDGTWTDGETTFYELVTFGDMAEHVAELAKGTRVVACGKVEVETWTGKDGTERETLKLLADEVGASLRYASVDVRRTSRKAPAERTAPDYDEEAF